MKCWSYAGKIYHKLGRISEARMYYDQAQKIEDALLGKDNSFSLLVSVDYLHVNFLSNRRLSQVISADYLRRKYLSQSAFNEPKAFYIGWHRRLSRAYFSSAMAGLK